MSSAIFGYGSLIFKPPPFELESVPGYIKGYKRRFAQNSHDHRGTPEKPGRVVTLVSDEDWIPYRKDEPTESGHVWGRVFRIPPAQASEIWAYLDHREKDGYTLRVVDVFGIDGNTGKEVIIEKGETHNPSFAGATTMSKLADQISTSIGPSGPNKDYLYQLCDSVKKLCPDSEDNYLRNLERLVRERDEKLKGRGSRI